MAVAGLIPLLISIGSSAASAGISALMAPKPKPQFVEKNKFSSAEFQASFVQLGTAMSELFGGRQPDGFGGFRMGGNYFYLSDIRRTATTSTSSSGGKGRPRQTTTTTEYHHHQDIGVMVGFGNYEILEIILNDTKSIYKNYSKSLSQIYFEAESGTLAGGASSVSDSDFSSGHAVLMPTGATITKTITGDGQKHALYIQYKSAVDTSLFVSVDGVEKAIDLPETFDQVGSVTLIAQTSSGSNVVILEAPTQTDDLFIDKVIYGEIIADSNENLRLGAISGIKNPNYVNPVDEYDHLSLLDPTQEDSRPLDQYNYQGNPNADGEIVLDLPSGASLRIYEGTATQNPDPVIVAYYAAQGLTGAPAYRHRTYFILENLEVTEFGGGTPQITIIAQHKTIKSVGGMYRERALRTGLTDEEIDFSAFDDIPLRGFNINQIQAPRTEMELINQIHDIAVTEDESGVIVGIVPDEEIVTTLYLKDLDFSEAEKEKAEQIPIKETVTNPVDVPKKFTVLCFDPMKGLENGSGVSRRQTAVSERIETFNSGMVLTQDEVNKVADRMHQKKWAERNPGDFVTAQRHSFLKPYDLVKVQELDESFRLIRILQKNGGYIGPQKFKGKVRNLLEPFPRIFTADDTTPQTPILVDIPSHIVGTIIDVAILRTGDNTSGFYAACARTDKLYRWNGAALYWERQTGYEALSALPLEATLGRTVTGSDGTLADVPGGWEVGEWDEDSEITFDLFNGSVETLSDDEVLDGKNILLVGDELIAFANATAVPGYPNRWTVSRLRRRLKSTVSTTHVATERVCLLNDAVKWIPMDISEFEQTHNYKFVSAGQDVDSAARFLFQWLGVTRFNTPIYQISDTGVPELSGPGLVTGVTGDGVNQWIFNFPLPLKNGVSLKNVHYMLLDDANYKQTVGSHSNSATSITLNNVTGLPTEGRFYIGEGPNDGTDEIILYTGISGNTLTGVTRGAYGTTARTIADDTTIFHAKYEFNIGNRLTDQMLQEAGTKILIYRMQNAFFRNGSDGYSSWSTVDYFGSYAIGFSAGYGAGGSVTPPPSVPAVPPDPPDGFENPYDPETTYKNYYDF